MNFLRNRLHITLFLFLLILGFIFRLYRFDNPIADWHSWRQADTSSVSRNFIKYGFDLLHPRMNNISNVQSGLENPKGYFYAEFPLYNATQAGLFKLFGYFTIEEWGRLVNICMSLFGAVFLFFLIRKRQKTAGWLVLLFSLFLPYNIYYNRTILPDTSMVAAILGGIYFFDLWVEELRIKYLCISLIFASVALLLKPYAIFYAVLFFVIAWRKFGIKTFARFELWVFALFALLPLVCWRYYMRTYPEGIPANAWLFNSNGIRFRPAFFRWIFYERLTRLISGYFNTILLALGIVGIWKEKDRWFLFSFGASALLYLCVIATGNVQHDYYQIVIMPTIVIFMAFGAMWLTAFLKKFLNEKIVYGIISIIILVGFWLSWQQVRDYFNINNPAIVEAGKAVDRLTPKNAKIIAPLDGDSSFLYQTNRQGWASFEHDLTTLITMGANYLVLVHPTVQDIAIGKQYVIVAQTPEYILFNLNKKP